MVLGVVALPFAFLPCFGFLSLPLSVLGLLLGVAGGAVALARGGRGIGFPIAGSAISLVGVLVGALWLGLLAAFSGATTKEIEAQARAAAERERRPDPPPVQWALPPEAAPREEWADASTASLTRGEITVRVEWVEVNRVPLNVMGVDEKSKEQFLKIKVRVSNNSATRVVRYSPWINVNRDPARVSDNFGNEYKPVEFGPFRRNRDGAESTAIHPGQAVTDVLVFEQPIENVQHLNLELPASAFSGTGPDLRFRIPASMIRSP
jgi:hypothetical protein